jgi:O-acetyl-ADP-ribose deacetylase
MNNVLSEQTFPSGQILQIVQGDITAEAVDAIVNAANSHLQHGGGVAGVIAQRGGAAIQRESDEWVQTHGPVSHAAPAWTSGGSLPARYVIHAVGPVWSGGDEARGERSRSDANLAAAVDGSLRLADQLKLASISLPAISTGIFGFPKERAAGLMFTAIEGYFVEQPASGIKSVRLVLFDQPTLEAFQKVWREQGRGG